MHDDRGPEEKDSPSGSLWRPQNETLQYEQSPTIRRETLLHLSVGAIKHPHLRTPVISSASSPLQEQIDSPLLRSPSTQTQRHSDRSSLDKAVALHRPVLHLPSPKDQALLLDRDTRAVRDSVLESGEVGRLKGERMTGEIANKEMHGLSRCGCFEVGR